MEGVLMIIFKIAIGAACPLVALILVVAMVKITIELFIDEVEREGGLNVFSIPLWFGGMCLLITLLILDIYLFLHVLF